MKCVGNKGKRLVGCAAVVVASVVSMGSAGAAISDIYTGGAGTYTETGMVTSILNSTTTANTFTVQDGTGSVIVYGITKTTYTATVGDAINFTATNSPYQGAPELVNSGFTLNSVPVPGAAPAPTVLTIPEFKAAGDGTAAALPPNGEAIVELDGVTFSPTTSFPGSTANATYTLTDSSGNTTSLYAYKSDSGVVAAEVAANAANPSGLTGVYNVVGYTDVYYGVPEIYPLSIVAVAPAPEPASLGLLMVGGVSLLARRRVR